MISLEQVRALEDRVEKAVAYIAKLREHSAELERRLAETQSFIDEAAKELAASEEKSQETEAKRKAESERIREVESRLADMAERVAAAETRAAELSSRAEEYRKDQAKIEEGIVHALERLDSFEDLMLGEDTPGEVAAEPAEAKQEEAREDTADLSPGPAIEDESTKSASPENELDIF